MKQILKITILILFSIIFSCNIALNNTNIDLDKDNSKFINKELENIKYRNNDIINLFKSKIKNNTINLYLSSNLNQYSLKSSTIPSRKKIFTITNENEPILHKNNISKSDLIQFDGDIIIDKKIKISSLKVNNDENLLFENGIILLKLKEPSKLEYFIKKYNGQILSEINGYYRIKIDNNTAPINNIHFLFKELNNLTPINIDNIEFSSIDALKTVVIILDFILNNKDAVESLILDSFSEQLPSFKPEDLSEKMSCSKDSPLSTWWLEKTNTISSWEYSIGTNKTIAWLETNGFKSKHPEINRRIKDFGDNNQSNSPTTLNNSIVESETYLFGTLYDILSLGELQTYHGHYALMTCCAERNNGLKTVGVAPNVNIAPYSFQGIYSLANAINKARKNKVDVIGINQDFTNFIWGNLVVFTSDKNYMIINALSGVGPAELEIKEARLKDDIPVVVAAHNFASNIYGIPSFRHLSTYFPASSPYVITVGSIEPSSFNCSSDLKEFKVSWDNDNKDFFGNGKGSNYGKFYMVWAPGIYILNSRFETDISKLKDTSFYKDNPNLVSLFGGTSAATPFTAGVIALMKSRNNSLSAYDIEQILYESNFPIKAKPHLNMINDGFINDVRVIDTQFSVEEAIRKRKDSKNNPSDFIAKDLGIGIFNLNVNSLDESNDPIKVVGTLTYNDGAKKNILRTVSNSQFNEMNGKLVNILGWDSDITGFNQGIEVLDIKAFDNKPKITSLSQTSNEQIYNIKVSGENFYKYPNHSTVEVTLQNKSTNKINTFYVQNNPSNNGKEFSFSIENKLISTSTVNGVKIETREFDKGDYGVSIKFGSDNKSATDFSDVSITTGQNTFKIHSTIVVNNQRIPVIENGSTTQVHKGDTVAIAINPAWRDIEWVVDSSKSVKLSQIVDKYAITKVPPDLPEYFQSVLMQFVLSGTKQYVSYEKALEILAYPETLSYQGSNIPVVASGTNTMVISGSKIAVPLPSDVIERLQNKAFYSDDKRYTYYDVVNEYAILGVPPNLSSGIKNIILKDLSTGDTVLTFEQALHKAALAMNLNPVTPADAINLPNSNEYPPFIYDKTSMDTHIGDIVAAALYGLSQNDNVSVTVNGQDMPIYDKKDGYLSFKIQGNLSGINSVNINVNNESITYRDALNILGGVSNNQKIAFIENSMLYTMDPDGSNIKSIAPASDLFLSWSPDKSKIAYTSNEAFTLSYVGGPVLLSKVVVTDSDGNSKIKVSKGGINTRDSYPVWSYDGTKIAFFRHDLIADKSYLCTVDFNDSSENILLEISKYTTALSWSRDNSKISYVVQNPNTLIQELHVFDGTTDRKLFDNVGVSEWTLDNKIVYTKDNMIMKCSIDGSNNLPLTPGFVANISNDGTKIAFMNQYNIYTMNIDGSNITKLTDYDNLSNVPIYNFSWSQDDSGILFDYVTPSGDMHYISKIENNSVTNIYSAILDNNFFTNDIKWSIKNKKDKKRGAFNNLAW
jgi:subtilisin family serine protease